MKLPIYLASLFVAMAVAVCVFVAVFFSTSRSDDLVVYTTEFRFPFNKLAKFYLTEIRSDYSDYPELISFTLAHPVFTNVDAPITSFNDQQLEVFSMVEIFVDKGVDVNYAKGENAYSKVLSGATVLHELTITRDDLLMREMIRLGARKDMVNHQGQTPLELAYLLQSRGKEDFSKVIEVLNEK